MTHSAALLPALAACLLGLTGTSPASAQDRLERECSAADIRQALAGDYAGPPCRFTQMPDDVDPAVIRSSAPQLAGAPPRVPSRLPARRTGPSPGMPGTDRIQGRAPLGRPFRAPASPEHRQPTAVTGSPTGGAVRLDDSFFSGGLVGGVGQVPTVQYGYRGIIVIDGAGRASLLPPGQLSGAPVLRMQARGALRTQLVGQ